MPVSQRHRRRIGFNASGDYVYVRPIRIDRRYARQGYDQGYRDGITKAQEDSRDGDRYDPARHDWYKSGTRGYDSRDGTREDYRAAYRSGFVQGYDTAYRGDVRTTDRDRDRDRQGDSIWERITGRNDGR